MVSGIIDAKCIGSKDIIVTAIEERNVVFCCQYSRLRKGEGLAGCNVEDRSGGWVGKVPLRRKVSETPNL